MATHSQHRPVNFHWQELERAADRRAHFDGEVIPGQARLGKGDAGVPYLIAATFPRGLSKLLGSIVSFSNYLSTIYQGEIPIADLIFADRLQKIGKSFGDFECKCPSGEAYAQWGKMAHPPPI